MNILNGLTLTPFEWSMSNELSGSLMEFVVRVCCTGQIDTEKFNQAVAIAVKRQPLLQANATVGSIHTTSQWRPASNPVPIIQWLDGDPTLGRGSTDDFRPIELETEIGFRFYGWKYHVDGEMRTEMRFVFQHACCDGKGAFGFVEDVLCEYWLLKGELPRESKATPTFESNRILDRDQATSHSFNFVDRIWRTFVVRPKRAANMLLVRPLLFGSASKTDNEKFNDPPRQCSATLDLETTEKLGVHATSVGATTNLVLARELFHVVGDYLESSGAMSDGSRGNAIRMLIPFSLRNETHRHMPAANCVSMAYLETRQDTLAWDNEENPVLLADLVKQYAFIRRWKLQYSWIESIAFMARLGPMIRLLKPNQKKNNKQVATTVLTNLGRVFSGGLLPTCDGRVRIGSLEIETVQLVLPCNANQRINFSVNFYGDRLNLGVCYLPSVTEKTAQELLESWHGRILAAVS